MAEVHSWRARLLSRERVLVAGASAAPLGAQIVISLAVSRIGGERALGQLLIASNVVGLFALIGDAGVGSAFLRLGRDTIEQRRAEWVWSARLGALVATTSFLGLCILASPVLSSRLGELSILDLIAVLIAGYFSVLSADELSVEAAIGSTSRWAIRMIVRTSVYMFGLVGALVLADMSTYTAMLIGTAAGFVSIWLVYRGRFGAPKIRPTTIKTILRQGSGLTIGVAFGTGSTLLAPLIASEWLDLTEIGRLRAAMLLSGGLLTVAAVALASVFLPRMATLRGFDRAQLMTKTLVLGGAAGVAFSLLPVFGFVMDVLKVENSATQRSIWVAICLSDGVRLVSYIFGYVNLASGSVRSFLIREVCSGVVLVVAVLATHSSGLVALTNAYLAASLFTLSLNAFWAVRTLSRAVRRATILWTGTFVVAIVGESLSRSSSWLPAATLGGVAAVALAGRRLAATFRAESSPQTANA